MSLAHLHCLPEKLDFALMNIFGPASAPRLVEAHVYDYY